MENRNRKGILIIVSVVIVLLLIIISGGYLFLHNKSYKNQAIECGDAIYLNEIKYSPVASSDLKEYNISNVLICKTDTGMKLYKINDILIMNILLDIMHGTAKSIKKMKQIDKEILR